MSLLSNDPPHPSARLNSKDHTEASPIMSSHWHSFKYIIGPKFHQIRAWLAEVLKFNLGISTIFCLKCLIRIKTACDTFPCVLRGAGL